MGEGEYEWTGGYALVWTGEEPDVADYGGRSTRLLPAVPDQQVDRRAIVGEVLFLRHFPGQRQRLLYPGYRGGPVFGAAATCLSRLVPANRHWLLRRLHDLFHVRVGNV